MLDKKKLRNFRKAIAQDFLSMLNEFESAGVTDIRVVRRILQSGIDDEIAGIKKLAIRSSVQDRIKIPHCKACFEKSGLKYRMAVIESGVSGMAIAYCRKCAYSEVIS